MRLESLKFESSAFAFVCFEISTLLKHEIPKQTNAKADESNSYPYLKNTEFLCLLTIGRFRIWDWLLACDEKDIFILNFEFEKKNHRFSHL